MRTRRPDAGFSLAALIFFATAASILIAAAVPAYQMQARREMELELVFRGEEYVRAIQKYQRKFGVYPSSVEQLVSTNGLRFLRRAYKDPMTEKEFRLITINPDGSVTGSKLFMSNAGNQPLFGNTQIFGQNPQGAQQQVQQGRGQQQAQPQQFQQLQLQGQQQRGFQPGSPQQNTGRGFGGSPQQFQQFQQGRGQQLGQPPAGPVSGINPAAGTPVAFGGIIGVASDSEKESIMVYNTRQKYDEWEFIAILGQPGQPGGVQNPQLPPNQQPNQNPQQQNPLGQRQNTPFQIQPTNPLGGPPTTSPFGPVGPQRGMQPQPQSPFGFGGVPQPGVPRPQP